MIQRMTTLGIVALALIGAFAEATPTKYMVRFKSADTFHAVVQNMKAARSSFSNFGADVAPMRLLNTNAAVAETLENVQLLIIESDDANAVESLRRHPAVAMVEQEIFHPLPRPMATWSKNSVELVQSPRKSSRRKIDMPWGIQSVKAPAAWSKTKGQMARVMVLDTGLDTGHPALRSRFEKGRNFAGGSASDITDQVGHGTHVAGTVLASGQGGSLIGVAPRARLLAGKVCGTRGCSSAAIAAGINWAVSEKVDVVNMSLGGMFISESELQAIRAAEAAGVFIAAASGNDGTSRVSFPAAVATITAVGATDINNQKATFSQWGPELDVVAPGVEVISAVPQGTGREAVVQVDLGKGMDQVNALPFVGSPLRTVQAEIVFAGLGKVDDVKNMDLTGKIAFIQRGEISFKDKVANVINRGAVAAVIFNNAPGLIQGSLTEDGSEAAIPAAMVEKTLGDQVKGLLDNGQKVRFSLSVDPSDYASFQGTSMASPHVAGVAALIRAANKSLSPAQVRDLLKQTATPLGPNSNNEYGSGLVNAEAAVIQAIVHEAPLALMAN